MPRHSRGRTHSTVKVTILQIRDVSVHAEFPDDEGEERKAFIPISQMTEESVILATDKGNLGDEVELDLSNWWLDKVGYKDLID